MSNVFYWVNRYQAFLAVLAVNLLLLLVNTNIGYRSLENTWTNTKEMLAIIPPVFILLGLLDVWVEREVMIKYMGEGSGVRGILIAFLLGSAAAGPLYAAFPIAGMMIRKGSCFRNVFIFVGAWSTTKIPLLTFEASSLGLRFTHSRLACSIAGILLIAVGMDKALSQEEKSNIVALNQELGAESKS